jgi:hypothetical protein
MFAQSDTPSVPVRGNGDIDATSGYGLQTWTAAHLPIAGLMDFALHSNSLRAERGDLRGLIVRMYGIPASNGAMESHLAASAELQNARVAVAGLSRPLDGLHGTVDAGDGGLSLSNLRGTVAGAAVRANGGVIGLTAPQVRLAVTGDGDLERLRSAFAQAARLPVRGALHFSMLVEGSASAPMEWIAVRAPHVVYADRTIENTNALVAYDGHRANLLDVRATALGAVLTARGSVAPSPQPGAVDVLASVSGPVAALPYGENALPGMMLRGVAVATADDPKALRVRGTLTGIAPDQQLHAMYDVDARGTGSVGPALLTSGDGSLYARLALDRPHGRVAAFVDARRYRVPAFDASVTGSGVGVEGAHGDIAALGRLSMTAPWGAFSGSAAYGAGMGGAASGRFDGSLAASPLRGSLPVSGRLHGNVSLAYDNGRMLVHVAGAPAGDRLAVSGVPVSDVAATIGGTLSNLHVYGARARVAGGDAIAAGSANGGRAVGVSLDDARVLGSDSVAATVSGSNPRDVSADGTVLLRGGRVRGLPAAGHAAIAYGGGTVAIRSADAIVGPAFASADGTVRNADGQPMNAGISAARYDIDARVQTADASRLLAVVAPSYASLAQASFDGVFRIAGTGANGTVAGSVRALEGSVNGLPFTNAHAIIAGAPGDITFRDGGVDVGSTVARFSGALAGNDTSITVSAPHANLADFNDAFDTGETFAGTGSLSLAATVAGRRVVSTRGAVALSNVRYRRLALGTVDASWHSVHDTIAGAGMVGGTSGTLRLSGTVDPVASAVALRGSASGMDLGTWLPMLGFAQLPVTGTLDATASVSGRYPDLSMQLAAKTNGARAGRLPIDVATIEVAATNGRGTIRSANLVVPGLATTASGTFGLHRNDRLDVTVRNTSPDLATLAKSVTGSTQGVSGSLDTSAVITGTPLDPHVTDDFTIASLTVRRFNAPRITGRLVVTRALAQLENGTIAFTKGSVTASAIVPIRIGPGGVEIASAPLDARLVANNVELSNFTDLLPQDTRLAGRIDGTVEARGTVGEPLLSGSLALANGSYSGPQDRIPVTAVSGMLNFFGNRATLSKFVADAGGGSASATGTFTVPNFRDPRSATFALRATARHARVNVTNLFAGTIDADITTSGSAAGAGVGGNVAISQARIPLTAFLGASKSQGNTSAFLPITFQHLTVAAGQDVRVQSGQVDIGAKGQLAISGTLAKPSLSGAFTSTGGTLSFYRTFTVQRGTVSFAPSDGIVPYVDAVATTYVTDPPTDVRLQVTGPATNLNLAFASDPSYNRAQILGLLVGAQQFGAVQGVASSGGGNGFSLGSGAQDLAYGQINTLFTRNLLEPLSSTLGSAVGLTNLQLTGGLGQGFGLNAAKAFGKDVTASYGESLGTPSLQTVAISVHPSPGNQLRLRYYSASGPTLFGTVQTTPTVALGALNLNPVTSMPYSGGTNGFDFSYGRTFW